MLIAYGRNRNAEDIESTVEKNMSGRVAAIPVTVDQTEKLVAIIELEKRGDTDRDALGAVKNDITSALTNSHGLNVADLVLVSPVSIPTTTSGEITRSAYVENYRDERFVRLDV